MPKPLMLIIVIFRLLPTRDSTYNIVVILVPKDAVSVNMLTQIMVKTKLLEMIKLKVVLSAQAIQLLHAIVARITMSKLLQIFVFPALLVLPVVLVILLLKILTTKLLLRMLLIPTLV